MSLALQYIELQGSDNINVSYNILLSSFLRANVLGGLSIPIYIVLGIYDIAMYCIGGDK